MKRLILNRHAKSSWDHPYLSDFDRPLNERGQGDVVKMGLRLKAAGYAPAHYISSPALRAITTARAIAHTFGVSPEAIELDDRIYLAGTRTLLNVVNSLPAHYDNVILFGHNPGFTDLAEYFTHEALVNMPTCAQAVIEFPYDTWNLVSGGTGKLVHYDFPKKK
jgi:phosphohistidine phosphatase